MSQYEGLRRRFDPDPDGLVRAIMRQGTPRRVFHIELFQDAEVQSAIAERFGLMQGVPSSDPDYARRRTIAVQRFCGFDYVRVGLTGLGVQVHRQTAPDTAGLPRDGGRAFQDEHTGPIQTWADFERFPWPEAHAPAATAELEWFSKNLPEDMCLIGSGGLGHFAEWLTWLMGYETLCYALFEQRDLVKAIADKLREFYRVAMKRVVEFPRVRMTWGADDMGFKTGLLLSPADLREFVLPGHRELAAISHEAGKPYLLHSCGKLAEILDDLIDDVRIDAKHSFEDTIEDVREVKHTYGRRIGLLGGIDVDFLCRSDERAIRARVRDTLDRCMPGGGYCLGTGNSVANYIPLDNYLAMLDEGRLYA